MALPFRLLPSIQEHCQVKNITTTDSKAEDVTFFNITTLDNISGIEAGLDLPLLVNPVKPKSDLWAQIPGIVSPIDKKTIEGRIGYSNTPVTVGKENFSGQLIIAGTTAFNTNVHTHLSRLDKFQIPFADPLNYFEDRYKEVSHAPVQEIVICKVEHFCVIAEGQIPCMLLCVSLPLETRMLSILFCLYKQVRTYIASTFHLVSLPQNFNVHLQWHWQLNSTTAHQIATGLALLTPAFSSDTKIASKIAYIINAVAAAGNSEKVTEEEVRRMKTDSGWTLKDISGRLKSVICRIVCMNKEYDHSSAVKVMELCPVEDIVSHFDLTDWAGALITQARMVYEQYHSKSIRFAVAVLPEIEKLFPKLGFAWEEEFGSLQHYREQLSNRPYTGLAESNMTVSRVSRAVYIGLMYYKANLVDQVDIENFNHFNIAGVKNHIRPQSDIITCDHLISILKVGKISAVIEFAAICPFQQAEKMIARLSDTDQETIFNSLASKTVKGEWYSVEKARRERLKVAHLN